MISAFYNRQTIQIFKSVLQNEIFSIDRLHNSSISSSLGGIKGAVEVKIE
jgi:hypothetical protein